jgi:protein transport protein SEC13
MLQDNIVNLWTKKKEDKDWKREELKNFNVPVWRVSWSHCGSLLAVSAGNNCVYLFKVRLHIISRKISSLNGS